MQAQSQKSFTATLLLLIFLGGLGVHRMYVGKVGTGVLLALVSIFTFGVGGMIWWIVDLYLLLSGEFTDKQNAVVAK